MVVTYRLVVTGSGSSSLMTTGSGCGGDVGGGGGGVRLWCGVVWVAVVGIDAAVTWWVTGVARGWWWRWSVRSGEGRGGAYLEAW